MKINRWIFVPLFLALSMGVLFAFTDRENWLNGFLKGFILGAIEGFILQLWAEYRTRKITKNNQEEDFSVKQKRDIVLLLNFDTTFDLCKQAISDLKTAGIKVENQNEGFIKAKTRMNFHSFGTDIIFNLKSINENLTEVEILTHPSMRTTIVDYGESLRLVEKITQFLKEKDAEINKKVLVDSAEILDNIYVKPFQKEKIER